MKRLILALAVLFGMASAGAQTVGDIHVADAKARQAAPGMPTGVIYLTIMNHGAADDILTGLSTPVAERAEAHRTTMDNGVMKMDLVPSLTIKAGDGVTFAPGGLHIMLIGLRQPLLLGQTFPLTLTFAKAGQVNTIVTVSRITAKMHDMEGMKM